MPLPDADQAPPVQRRTARDSVFETLRDWIETGVLAPGEQLRDTEIAEHLGVSRTPVREALFLLERLQVVETAPRRRTVVSEIRAGDAAALALPLAALHAAAAAEAARTNPSVMTALVRVNDQLARDVRNPEMAHERRGLDDEFHALIVDATGNPYLAQALDALRVHHRRLATLHFAGAGPSRRSVSDHRAIVRAIGAGDPDAASMLMHAHWARLPGR
jgi:DNA-binding GntR family transcriptional regulator